MYMYLMYGKYSLYFTNPLNIGDTYYVDAHSAYQSFPWGREGEGPRDEASADYANTSWKHAEPISPVL